jgi:hypothetical protein
MKDPMFVLQLALLIATLGMALVVLGTTYGALFMPGTIVLAIGLFGAAAAGLWRMFFTRD